MRLFLGIELTDPLRAQLDRIQSLLRTSGADVRWVDVDGAHLTLHFLGEIDAALAARIDAALAPAIGASPAMSLRLEGVGAFPDERRPRVVWVGCGGDLGALRQVHEAAGVALRGLGLETEARRFHPHITLGRVRSPRNLARLSTGVARLRDAHLGTWHVSEVILFRSELSPAGARYSPQSRYRLGAGSSPGG